MSVHQRVAERTQVMESAIYAALDAVDAYAELLRGLIVELEAADEPNEKLIKRCNQFLAKAASMTSTLEDDVVTDLLFCLDRLFAVALAERGEFI